MAPDRSPSGAYDPPIPTYDEAMAASSSSADGVVFEQQSLLRNPSAGGSSHASSSRRQHADGYRAPTVESDDDDGSEDDFFDADDDNHDGEHADDDHETNLVRREMQEFDMDDNDAGSGRSLFGKRINFSLLPAWKWRWRWRIPRLQIRLPRASDVAAAPPPPPSVVAAAAATPTDSDMADPASWRTMMRPDTHLVFLVARLFALFLIMGFFYLLFSGTLVGSIGRMSGMQPSPETVRNYLLDSVDPRRLRASVQHFSAYAHLAGSEGGYAMAKDVETMFRRAGLQDVVVDEYYVHLNYPVQGGRGVQILDEHGNPAWEAHMEEEDLGSETAGRLTLAFHALSRDGTAEGPLVYANYGSREDFRQLAEMGVETHGAVALVRYGGAEPNLGLKVKAAEEAGFAGCMVYADPGDDGFVRGPVAPAGPYMPADGVHRGSVALPNWVMGDVLTPGWESKKGLPRMDTNHTRGMVKIPSIPLAWRDAQVLLQQLVGFGRMVPQPWVGAVPDVREWWTGAASGPRVRMRNVQDEASQKTIVNVHGRIEGYEQGGKSVIIGNARDTLAFGATDPHSGTAVMIELARLFGGLAAQGWQPLRTIEFASWDGEAYNNIGSTEHVERRARDLRRDAVAYINVAAAVTGSEFHASGSPALGRVVEHVLAHVGDPRANDNLLALWQRRGGRIEPPAVGDGAHVPFLTIAGTSALDVRFEGGVWPRGSGYDDFDFVGEIGDPGWVYHTLAAQVVGLLVVELSDRHMVPLELGTYGDALEAGVSHLAEWVTAELSSSGTSSAAAGAQDGVRRGLTALAQAAANVKQKTGVFEAWAAGWQRTMLASGWVETQAVREERWLYNSVLAGFETALLDTAPEGGYPNRTQFKHVLYGPRTWSLRPEPFPGIRDAVADRDWPLAERLLGRAIEIIGSAAVGLGSFQPSAVL